jgi:hypothetical protein
MALMNLDEITGLKDVSEVLRCPTVWPPIHVEGLGARNG